MLLDLASFNNIQQNGQADFTGTHAIKNLSTGENSVTNFHDHKGGQFSTVGNTINKGAMNIAGNHMFDNTQNFGQLKAMPRTFNPDGSPAQLMLMDLANFNNFANMEGGNASFQGTHAIKNLDNAKGGNVQFLDHKNGQFSTVGNMKNAGNMNIAGLHQFDNTVNSGNLVAAPRTFNPDGTPAQLMLIDLATFNNVVNKGGAQMALTGDHMIKNVKNEAKAKFMLNDHKDGQKTMIENVDNSGEMKVQGNHVIKNIKNNEGSAFAALERAFPDKKKDLILLDLATFGNIQNAAGSSMKISGEQKINKIANAKDANMMFEDHKKGEKAMVKELKNEGNISVSGNHMFESIDNQGKIMAEARKYNEDGSEAKMVLMLI